MDLAREVACADVAWIVTSTESGPLQVQAVSGLDVDVLASLRDDSLTRLVLDTGAASTVEEWSPDTGPAIMVPMGHAPVARGVLALAWTRERADHHYAVDIDLPASFAEQAALAMQVARGRDDQRRLAVFEDRDRIGRDLHDLVIQRLFAVGLGLQGAARMSDRPEMSARLERAVDDLDATIKDIRRAIFGLGALESSGDIQSEVTGLIDRAASTLKFRPSLRLRGSGADPRQRRDRSAPARRARRGAVQRQPSRRCDCGRRGGVGGRGGLPAGA